MNLQIERPDWHRDISPNLSHETDICKLNKWFDANVAPINKMLAEGTGVYCTPPNNTGQWIYSKEFFKDKIPNSLATHESLMINIQPIKNESAKDVLQDLYDGINNNKYRTANDIWNMLEDGDRAKKVLEEE